LGWGGGGGGVFVLGVGGGGGGGGVVWGLVGGWVWGVGVWGGGGIRCGGKNIIISNSNKNSNNKQIKRPISVAVRTPSNPNGY